MSDGLLSCVASVLALKFTFQLNVIHPDGTIVALSADTLHAVITDFVGIQVAAVALTAADAQAIIEHALLLLLHVELPLLVAIL